MLRWVVSRGVLWKGGFIVRSSSVTFPLLRSHGPHTCTWRSARCTDRERRRRWSALKQSTIIIIIDVVVEWSLVGRRVAAGRGRARRPRRVTVGAGDLAGRSISVLQRFRCSTGRGGAGRTESQAGVKRCLVTTAPRPSFDRATLRSTGQRDAGRSSELNDEDARRSPPSNKESRPAGRLRDPRRCTDWRCSCVLQALHQLLPVRSSATSGCTYQYSLCMQPSMPHSTSLPELFPQDW